MRNAQTYFETLLKADSEEAVASFLLETSAANRAITWHPLGSSENNFGVIENQQSSSVAALIEKVTNSIDATLMRHCIIAGVDPKSEAAPRTMKDAIELFFGSRSKSWGLHGIMWVAAE